MAKQKLYELTPEHRAQFQPWADKWIANAMSTEPMDDVERDRIRAAIRGLYAAADLRPPPDHRIVFVPSPFVARFAGGFAAAIWHLRGQGTEVPPFRDGFAAHGMEGATQWVVRQATAVEALKVRDIGDSGSRRKAASVNLDHWYVCPIQAIRDLAKKWLGDQASLGLTCAIEAASMWDGGNGWSEYPAFLSVFRHIAKLNLDYSKWQHYETAAEAGPRIMHKEFCLISERPEILTVDDRRRPHGVNGPFCRWRDGTALYAWHGVRVPAWVIEQPDRITTTTIAEESNVEIRRAMIERIGWEQYLSMANAQVVQRDDFGTLLRLPALPGDQEPLLLVRVTNSTPEPDGSYKDYILRVDTQLRPLLNNGQRGPAQDLRALNAVASTFGMRGEDYVLDCQS